jgi:hypothetical protein
MVSKHLGPMLVPLGLDKVDLWDASPPWCKNGEIMDTNKLLLAKKMCMNVMHIVHTHKHNRGQVLGKGRRVDISQSGWRTVEIDVFYNNHDSAGCEFATEERLWTQR